MAWRAGITWEILAKEEGSDGGGKRILQYIFIFEICVIVLKIIKYETSHFTILTRHLQNQLNLDYTC